ncbi:glycosyltransferase involved in cell wall biosynthesis [Edaphobacter aggregans]|jgi:glycosyltransferase involved in cell wall biosynthesis|uniref:Glycosyltransferase involved in cell wall biosynthesis n=1 Tax=Edaphobacter aggregans TaxID=570835 RepID=A0A428MLE9_9BACT|nr:glycosyltransferase [Edaphobacter aggregans]RSL17553.1 glycosyltransferase involved in cell wall biosynthesis [Edaphobacter aggregans]
MQSNTIQRREGGRRTLGHGRTEPPLVSIITVVFRAKDDLASILNSIFEHNPRDFELIVIDGNSGDGTVELLQEWDEKVDYWLSEPDMGIYDAMNKAQAVAQGDFLLHLNAGDKLLQLPKEELELARRENIDVATFRVSVDGTREFIPSCGSMLKLKNTLHHQGTFYRRQTFLPYDLRYKILADYDVNQRLALRGAKMKAFDKVVAWHASGGLCDNIDGYSEHASILRKNYGWPYVVASLMLNEWKGIKARRKAALKRWLQKRRASK